MTGLQYTSVNKWFYENVRPSYHPFFESYKTLWKKKYSELGPYTLSRGKIQSYLNYQKPNLTRYEPFKPLGYQSFGFRYNF
jgi:hypothetical protein